MDVCRFGGRLLQPLVRSHEVVDRPSQLQKSVGRGEALEVTHGLVPLLYVLVVALDRVVVMLQAISPARDGDTEPQSGYPIEVTVKHSTVLPELVGDEGHQFPLPRRLRLLLSENLVYLRSNSLFSSGESQSFVAAPLSRLAISCGIQT